MGMKILIEIFFLTRGHEVTLVKDQCRLDIRKYSSSHRTINELNKLSTDCLTASSMNMFKNNVDKYLQEGRLHLPSGPLLWMVILLNLVTELFVKLLGMYIWYYCLEESSVIELKAISLLNEWKWINKNFLSTVL